MKELKPASYMQRSPFLLRSHADNILQGRCVQRYY